MGFFKKMIKKPTDPDKHVFCSAVVAAAGSSVRMNGEDKLLTTVGGLPVLVRTLQALCSSPEIDEIVVATKSEEIAQVADLCKEYNLDKVSKVVAGGETRCESVYNGVMETSKKAVLIAVHDGARPLVTEQVIADVVAAARKFNAAAPAVPVKETIKTAAYSVVTSTPNRRELYTIQTPQVFDAALLKAALSNVLEKKLEVTDDCMAVEALRVSVHLTEGSYENIKITTPVDMYIADAILKMRSDLQ